MWLPPLKVEDPRGTIPGVFVSGAGDGDRTRGLQLGKLTPYHSATPASNFCIQQSCIQQSCIRQSRSDSAATSGSYSSPSFRRRGPRNGPGTPSPATCALLETHVVALDGLVAARLPHHALGRTVEIELLIERH